MIKASIHQEDIVVLNVYVTNRISKYMRQKWTGLTGERNYPKL